MESAVMRKWLPVYKYLKLIPSLLLFAVICLLPKESTAASVQECMGQVKMFQTPSAMAGAAEICMQAHFDNLKSAADSCREQAALKSIPSASFAACQASLIFELAGQVDECEAEAEGLLTGSGALLNQLIDGAKRGCQKLAQQAAEICHENGNKFSGLAQSAAITACEQAGLRNDIR